jgi:transposase
MPQSYSYDLRMKVIDAIDAGMGKTQASKVFKISRNTINLWLTRRQETGNCRAKVGYQRGYNPKTTNLEEFREFVKKHGSQTQAEMAEAWGEKISDQTIGKALKKIGFTRKKTYGYRERAEEKRREFCQKISKEDRGNLERVIN